MDATDMTKAAVAGRKVFDLIDRQPPINVLDFSDSGDASETKSGSSGRSGEIEFKNVAFTYPSRLENKIYNDLSIIVEPGTTVALVGGSGSGKSTAVQLVERFYDPDSGNVFLDGVDLKDLAVTRLRKQLGLSG